MAFGGTKEARNVEEWQYLCIPENNSMQVWGLRRGEDEKSKMRKSHSFSWQGNLQQKGVAKDYS